MDTQIARERFALAHKITRRTVDLYGCDYRVTFGAALKLVNQLTSELLTGKYTTLDAPRWAKLHTVDTVLRHAEDIGETTASKLAAHGKTASIAAIWNDLDPLSQRILTLVWLARRLVGYEK